MIDFLAWKKKKKKADRIWSFYWSWPQIKLCTIHLAYEDFTCFLLFSFSFATWHIHEWMNEWFPPYVDFIRHTWIEWVHLRYWSPIVFISVCSKLEHEVIQLLTRWQDWRASIIVGINKWLQKIWTAFHQSKAIWLKLSSETNGIKPVIKDTKLDTSCV